MSHEEICGCGGKLRYSHIVDGKEKMSCNKYYVCMTWQEQFDQIRSLHVENMKMKSALEKICKVNACDYEYRSWAKAALSSE